MATKKIRDRMFKFQIASDVIRDGIGVELWEEKDGQEVHIAEIFRNDQKKMVEFSAEVRDLPVEVLEELMTVFRNEIDQKYQD